MALALEGRDFWFCGLVLTKPDATVCPPKTFYKAQVLPWDVVENPR